MSTSPQVPSQKKVTLERVVEGNVTVLTMHGIVDEGFEGQRIADSAKSRKLVVNLRDVRRFASWGMAEWMNFLRATADRDLYFIECSSYAVNQMNLVTGLLGHGKLVSFYTPYRCGTCGEEFETVTLVPSDPEQIRSLGDQERPCNACGGRARLEKFPSTMFATLAERPAFDIDDEVVAYLRTRFQYDVKANTTRFRAVRRVEKGYTYLRLSGDITTLAVEPLAASTTGTAVVDVRNIIFDLNNLTQWTAYLQAALPQATSVQLLDCPPGFFERGVPAADLQTKLKVRTFGLVYHCGTCNTQTPQLVDVAENLEQLIEGIVPNAPCPTCHSVMLAPLTVDQMNLIRRLPARERDAALDRFLAKVRTEPNDKMEDALVARAAEPPKAPVTVTRAMYVASALAVLVIVGLVVIAVPLWTRDDTPQTAAPTTTAGVVPPKPPAPAFQRPDWITSDVPSSSFCQDVINRLVCIGVSSYRTDRADAVAEAADAALDELVNSVGLKIAVPFFKDDVLATYSKARTQALSSLQAAETDRGGSAYVSANEGVRKARHAVVELLRASGGAAVPAQRSDWYWEEYNRDKGTGTEFLVFVRYDISLDAVKSLVDTYSTAVPALGGTAMTAFPALAWQHPDFPGGAILAKAPKGLAARQVVTMVGDQRVTGASDLVARLADAAKGAVQVTVLGDDAPAHVVTINH